MTLHHVAIYHNADSRFLTYQDGHTLTKVFSHWRHLPADTSPEQIADWAYHVFNADLDHLHGDRRKADGGELDFMLACTYRLLRLRSFSTGDVIGITTDENSTWLACEPTGWRRISTPENRTGRSLTAATVYQHLHPQRAIMRDHPCHQHRPGHHTDACLTGDCGFCGTSLHQVASGECRSCLRIVCEECDGGYQPDLGPICHPCTPPATGPTTARLAGDDPELHRLCVFEFALSCGHLVTAAVTGLFSPGIFGPTIPESSGPAYRDRWPCVDGISSSSWPHRSQGMEQPYSSRPTIDRPAPRQPASGAAFPSATPWHGVSVASRSKTGAAATRPRAARSGGATPTPLDIDARVGPNVLESRRLGPGIDGTAGPERVGENTGWYPVTMSCCDRLGGTVQRGVYLPYASQIDYVELLAQRYELRPKDTPRGSARLIGRRPRTDEPYQPPPSGHPRLRRTVPGPRRRHLQPRRLHPTPETT